MVKRRTTALFTSVALLAACSSGGGGESGGDDNLSTGTLNLGITDGPVDGVNEIVVEFDGITLKPKSGPPLEFIYQEPRSIDLKTLSNGASEALFEGELTAGEYSWIKLHVNADLDNVPDSYVTESDGSQVELRVPPDRLKLGNQFVITQGSTTTLMIEWNLRMGLTNPVGHPGYKLQPSLRVTDLTEHGTIEGSVAVDQLPGDCNSDPNTEAGTVAYVFEGRDVTPDDIDGTDAEPLTTADIMFDEHIGAHTYRVAYLSPGDYTVAFTCQAIADRVLDADEPGADTDDAIVFTPNQTARVSNGDTTTVNFPTG